MTDVVKSNKPLVVNPLKSSPAIGAALAFLGINRAIPMLHGSQGCTAFGKVFLVRHFREPIPLQTTAMDQVTTVMGPEDNVVEGLRAICEKNAPDLIGLPSTGLSDTQGSDLAAAVKQFRASYPEYDGVSIVPVTTPDFTGSLERGFAAALEALIDQVVPAGARAKPVPPDRVNILTSAHLNPGDIEAVADLVESFGLVARVVPNLADSLDGHLDASRFDPLTTGGTPVTELTRLAEARATLVIGDSIHTAADRLRERTGVPDLRFPHVMGLAATDALVDALRRLTGRPVPDRVERQRARLQDAMLDTHFMLSLSRFGVAAEPDALHAFGDLLASVGAETAVAVAPVSAPALKAVTAPQVTVGDLEDLERQSRDAAVDGLIGNSHLAPAAERLERPLFRYGFPIHDRLGVADRVTVGYEGARQTLFALANQMLEQERGELPVYHSALSQKSASSPGPAVAASAADGITTL